MHTESEPKYKYSEHWGMQNYALKGLVPETGQQV